MKKIVFILLLPLLTILASCNDAEVGAAKSDNSEVVGIYESNTSIKNYIAVNEGEQDTYDEGDEWLVSPTTRDLEVSLRNIQLMVNLPFYGVLKNGQLVHYNVDQKLTLQKDYNYIYNYHIYLGGLYNDNSNDENIVSIDVNMQGKYIYTKVDENNFNITLENPTKGYEMIYGCGVEDWSEPHKFWRWKKLASPSYKIDFNDVALMPNYEYDEYTSTRALTIYKSKETNTVTADYYNSNFLEYLSKYSIF